MARARKDGDPFGLAGTRLAFKHGAFYYRHREGRWERLGTDLQVAKARAQVYNNPADNYGTMSYWLDQFLLDCAARVEGGDLAPRTRDDYTKNTIPLKIFFGAMQLEHIAPHHVQTYLDMGASAGRGVRANREKACLSACISWMIRSNKTSVIVNPCMQKSGTKTNPEGARDRYVTHEEYRAVYAATGAQVRMLMELTYRTLQRPESDIIHWTPKVLTRDVHTGDRILAFEQGKTGAKLKIALTDDLAKLVDRATGARPRADLPLVHNRDEEAYTYSGISTLLHRAIAKVNKARASHGLPVMEPFGFRDLKGKGATDMWLAGVPIEQIQLLCGHKDKTTTERYIKARWRETAQPNGIRPE